jgi:hypothetical protein
MRMVTRTMLALGSHPRHIAELIRSKLESDYGWESQWLDTDPATRADFYTGVFSGLFAVAGPTSWIFIVNPPKKTRYVSPPSVRPI